MNQGLCTLQGAELSTAVDKRSGRTPVLTDPSFWIFGPM
jgi:hypothetical protein